jgi:Family of unknown function (DUF5989)
VEPKPPNKLENAQQEGANASFFSDLFYFLRHNKKWWLLPILLILIAMSLFLLISTGAVAPFIYTLF